MVSGGDETFRQLSTRRSELRLFGRREVDLPRDGGAYGERTQVRGLCGLAGGHEDGAEPMLDQARSDRILKGDFMRRERGDTRGGEGVVDQASQAKLAGKADEVFVDKFGDADVAAFGESVIGSADKHHGLCAEEPHLNTCRKPIGRRDKGQVEGSVRDGR